MKELLNEARHEILRLRRQNEILSAQQGVIEVKFAAAIGDYGEMMAACLPT